MEGESSKKNACLKTAQEEGENGAGRKGKLIRTESMSVVSVKSVQVSRAGRGGTDG